MATTQKSDAVMAPVANRSSLARKLDEQYAMVPTSMQEAIELSQIIARSAFCPKAYKGKPEDVMLAIQMGLEVGFKPMQAIQSIAVINGVPSIWGQGLIGLIQSSPVCEYIDVVYDPDANEATCRCKRVNDPYEHTSTFSWDDAVRAGLDKKDTYKQYPQNMLRWRAVGNAAKFKFGDVTKGLVLREEAADYPVVSGPSIGAQRLNERIEAEQKARAEQEPEAKEAQYEEVVEDTASLGADDLFAPVSDPPPSGVARSYPDDSTVRELDAIGLKSTVSMDRFVMLVLGDPEAITIDLSKKEGNKIAKAAKLVGENLDANQASQFVKFAHENGLALDSAALVIDAIESFRQSNPADG